ncbi:MAG TPA: hypothetical protein VFF12_00450 [Myxococcaceae bacterium]|nr:hypothetical protein [Myxococcaceae bacterium]
MAASGRELLGKRRAFGEMQRAYLRGAALEVDTYDWYDLRRRRIQLDEVQRITLHRELRRGTFGLCLGVGLIFAALAALVARNNQAVGAWISFALFAAAGLVGALWTLVFRSSVITVTSPRARVTIVHGGARRSREVFRLIADRTRETQAASSPAASEAPRAG